MALSALYRQDAPPLVFGLVAAILDLVYDAYTTDVTHIHIPYNLTDGVKQWSTGSRSPSRALPRDGRGESLHSRSLPAVSAPPMRRAFRVWTSCCSRRSRVRWRRSATTRRACFATSSWKRTGCVCTWSASRTCSPPRATSRACASTRCGSPASASASRFPRSGARTAATRRRGRACSRTCSTASRCARPSARSSTATVSRSAVWNGPSAPPGARPRRTAATRVAAAAAARPPSCRRTPAGATRRRRAAMRSASPPR